MRARLIALALVPVLVLGVGCAYFNTFYTAKKNFADAEAQMQLSPEPEARASAGAAALYDKAMQGAGKILVEYPDSKWVDDAVLLIGRSLLAKGDYEAAQVKFAELAATFPGSELRDQALYWSGVAAERDRRRPAAIALYDSLLATYPRSRLRDFALLRRSNLYLLAREPGRAEEDLRELSTRKGKLGYEAGIKLAEALFANRRFADARVEFARVAGRAPTEQLRQDARLRVGDCDEALSDFPAAIETYRRLLKDARTADGRARARLRYATALGLGGRVEDGLAELANVIEDQPRTPWAAEAAFRAGYLHEVVRDDPTAARESYEAVAQQQPGSPFVTQAAGRRDNLERLAAFNAAQNDSTAGDAAAEAIFQSAELYLFQLGKLDRALEEYARVGREYPDSPLAPRAAFARGWIQARRLDNPAGARAEFEALVARWPEAAVADDARRLLADPNDSTFAHRAPPATEVQFPLVPGNPMYVPPPPVAPRPVVKAPTSVTVPTPAVKTAADSAAAAAAARAQALSVARRESLRAWQDSVRRASRTRADVDSTGRLTP